MDKAKKFHCTQRLNCQGAWGQKGKEDGIPQELRAKLEELSIPLDSKVRSAIALRARGANASHQISQAYGAIALIRRDGGTQPRAILDRPTISEYAFELRAGAQFPPVVVFHDGTDYWLADGFHRVEAAESIKMTQIAAIVRQGTIREAVLYSVGANATHGLRR